MKEKRLSDRKFMLKFKVVLIKRWQESCMSYNLEDEEENEEERGRGSRKGKKEKGTRKKK